MLANCFILPRAYSAELVQAHGLASLSWFSMQRCMESSSPFAKEDVPRLRHWRAMIPQKISIMFTQGRRLGVKWAA